MIRIDIDDETDIVVSVEGEKLMDILEKMAKSKHNWHFDTIYENGKKIWVIKRDDADQIEKKANENTKMWENFDRLTKRK